MREQYHKNTSLREQRCPTIAVIHALDSDHAKAEHAPRRKFLREVDMVPSPDVEKLFETCEYRTRAVRCPHKLLPASVTAIRWKKADGAWVPWKIADCPLLPAGMIDCDNSCLAQLNPLDS